MKKNDIQVGKDYAVGQNLQNRGTKAFRYRAIKTGVERRTFIKRRGYGTPNTTMDGVLMERVETGASVVDAEGVPVREVIRSHDVYMLWTEYETMRMERDHGRHQEGGRGEGLGLSDPSSPRHTDPVRGAERAASEAVCPECKQGKCGNCDGRAWDGEKDEPTTCTHAHS
jgi:hypothetical protein